MKTAKQLLMVLTLAVGLTISAGAATATIIIGDGSASIPADKSSIDGTDGLNPFNMPEMVMGELPVSVEVTPLDPDVKILSALPDLELPRAIVQEPSIAWEDGVLKVTCTFSTTDPAEKEECSISVLIEEPDGTILHDLGSYSFTGGKYRREYRLLLGEKGLQKAGCNLVVLLYDPTGACKTVAKPLDMVPAAVIEPISLEIRMGRNRVELVNGVSMVATPFEYSSATDSTVAYAVYDKKERQVTSNSQEVQTGKGELYFLWSGNYQGVRCPSGYYTIQYSITDLNGETMLRSQETYLEIPVS